MHFRPVPGDRPLIVYGLDRVDGSKAEFRGLSPDGFLRDLARADAVIAHAGNQLISEALHLGKPMLAIPVPSQHEQHVNGFYLERIGGGWSLTPEAVTGEKLEEFIVDAVPRIARSALPRRENGVHEAARIISEVVRAV